MRGGFCHCCRLPYTEAVLTETQRMWTVTPVMGPRRVLRETNLLGYAIDKETSVLINAYSVNMDPDHFPQPHEFMPERFLIDGVFAPSDHLVFFGGGER